MVSISKNVYIDKLDIVNKHNTYHSTIETKPVNANIKISKYFC